MQGNFIQKYGTDEHFATREIASELGSDDITLHLLDSIGFSKIPSVRKKGSMDDKVVLYSDMRVGPFGIISIDERIDEGVRRRGQANNKTYDFDVKEWRIFLHEVEADIFSTTDITPGYITDERVFPIIEELKHWKL